MNRPRIAIIGCGGMGRAHANALLAFGGFDLVAAADPSPDARNQMQKVAEATYLYANTDEMLQKERPDLVVVATPALYHCAPTIAALRAGAHVLCENRLPSRSTRRIG